MTTETYIVDLGAVPELQGECFLANLFTAISRTGVLFLWPVKIPGADCKTNDWHVSAAVAAQCAMKNWVRVKSNMSLGAYCVLMKEEAYISKSSRRCAYWPLRSSMFRLGGRTGAVPA
jgi:hypothetical protein